MEVYRGFPRRPGHEVPGWVKSGALFHIRISIDQSQSPHLLTEPDIADKIMRSVALYEKDGRWHVIVFLLMSDHLHALLSFAPDFAMSRVIGDWKGFHARKNKIRWQEGFFDHRLRNDERREQLEMKCVHSSKSSCQRTLSYRGRLAVGLSGFGGDVSGLRRFYFANVLGAAVPPYTRTVV